MFVYSFKVENNCNTRTLTMTLCKIYFCVENKSRPAVAEKTKKKVLHNILLLQNCV